MTDTHPLRELLATHRRRRAGWALCLFLFDCAMFAALVALAIAGHNSAARAVAGIVAGFEALRLASIAHDAGHRNYTGNRTLDKIIARVAFLPALQPFGTWEIAHNVIHHSWTSIRGKDYVWIPKSKEEFDALPGWRRWLERLYRSPWGHGFYYVLELWLPGVFLSSFRWSEVRRGSHRVDIVLAGCFALLWGWVAVSWAARTGHSPAAAMFYGMVVPFLTWCELFGLTLYLQHTHPRARFFADRSECDFFASQAAASVHTTFPRGVEWLLHGIFEHTAHHLDTAIPFYELHAAQQKLDRALSGSNVVYRWSWREFLTCCRTCKLYDYARHRWLDFEGNVTAW